MKRNKVQEELCFIAQIEPTSINETSKDSFWIKAIKEELEKIEKKNTWELVPRLKDKVRL